SSRWPTSTSTAATRSSTDPPPSMTTAPACTPLVWATATRCAWATSILPATGWRSSRCTRRWRTATRVARPAARPRPARSTGLGHGDALHVGDFDPSRDGLEVFSVHESMEDSDNRGSPFRDAATGEVLWSVPAQQDTGRGAIADIDPRHEGAEAWNVGQEAE